VSTSLIELVASNIDRRLGLSRPGRKAANKVFPHHWSFLLGEVALISFLVLVLTGIFLTMFYTPQIDPVVYTGENPYYQGMELPAAYESLVRMSYDVPAGELFRRLHRIAAHVFLAAIVLHLARIFLTGAFRKPREVNYIVGLLLLMLGLGAGFTGQALPYDVIAGITLRITYSFILSIPWVGPQVAFWVFGGEFLPPDVLPRMYVLHVLLIPAGIATLIAVHLALIIRQKHTQKPHPSVDGQRHVVGTPMWPWQFVISTSLVLVVGAVMVMSAVLVPWDGTALHGPYLTGHGSNAAQPDWFLMWVEGALRIIPAFELNILGTVISQTFMAGVALPGLVFGFVFLYPWVERAFHPVEGPQHVLQHPFDVPMRAGLFAAGAVGIVMLTLAAMNDYISELTGIAVESIIWGFRVTVLVIPLIAGLAVAAYARRWPVGWLSLEDREVLEATWSGPPGG
jgi:ubiquinol-cytochrome c reductase cytochrome b subunit